MKKNETTEEGRASDNPRACGRAYVLHIIDEVQVCDDDLISDVDEAWVRSEGRILDRDEVSAASVEIEIGEGETDALETGKTNGRH